jgi:putative multiple sugar transport system substrate-binding protein
MKAKKLLALLLAGALTFSMAACGGSNAPAGDAAPAEEAAAEEAPAEEAVEEEAPAEEEAAVEEEAPAEEEAAAEEAPAEEEAAAEEEAPAAEAGGKKVGIAMPTQSLERWNRDGSFLEAQFQAAGYETELTYSDNDIKKQVSDIENLIADNVNLLVIAAIDGESLTQVLADAKDNNIPVISYDRLIMNTDAISYYVSFDNYTVGKLQGEFVVDTLGLKLDDTSKTYNIEFTAGDPADNNAEGNGTSFVPEGYESVHTTEEIDGVTHDVYTVKKSA